MSLQLNLDSFVTAICVAGTIWLLGFLDTHPMPHFAKGGLYDLDLKDIRFYCPPHVAIAIGMFNAKTLPALYTTFIGILIAVPCAVAIVEFGEPFFKGDTILLRAAVVGAATLGMKIGGAVFPPAGAVAVLFLDNPALKQIGRHFVLTPGLTGTIVIVFLAMLKITLMNALGGGEKTEKKKKN